MENWINSDLTVYRWVRKITGEEDHSPSSWTWAAFICSMIAGILSHWHSVRQRSSSASRRTWEREIRYAIAALSRWWLYSPDTIGVTADYSRNKCVIFEPTGVECVYVCLCVIGYNLKVIKHKVLRAELKSFHLNWNISSGRIRICAI